MSLHRRNPRRDKNEQGILKVLEIYGYRTFQLSARGLPDLLCFTGNGATSRAVLLEIKTKDGELTPAQKEFHQEASFKGWPVHVVTGADEALGVLDKYRKGER